MNFLDLFAQRLREKREQKKITQRELAERLLDGIVFHDRAPQTVAKCVVDYFAGKSEAESQKYIDLCMSADKLK